MASMYVPAAGAYVPAAFASRLFAAVLHGHGGAEHLSRVGAGERIRISRGNAEYAAGRQVGGGLAGPGGDHAVKGRSGHVGGAHDVVEHHRRLLHRDGLLGIEDGVTVGFGAAYDAVHQRRGDVALLPDGNGVIVGKARGRDGRDQLVAAQLHAHGQELAARDLTVGLKDIAASELLTDEEALLGEHCGRVAARVACEVGVGRARLLLLYADDDRGLLRAVARGIHGLIAEIVAAAAVGIGRVDEAAVVRELYLALGRLGGDLEGQRVAVGVHRREPAADGDVAVSRELHVLRHGRAALGVRGKDGSKRRERHGRQQQDRTEREPLACVHK